MSRKIKEKEHLDLQTLVNKDVPLRLGSGEEKISSWPKMIYVIDEDVDEAEENLTQKIARKMEDALNDKQDSNEFENQFDKDEKKQLTRI